MDPELPNVITAITALVGTTGTLVISLLTLRHTYWRDRPRLKITASESIIGGMRGTKLAVKVANVGTKPYTVTMLRLLVGHSSTDLIIANPQGTVQLPYVLQPGQTCDFWTSYDALKPRVQKLIGQRKSVLIRASVRDYVGQSIASRPHRMALSQTGIRRAIISSRTWVSVLLKKLSPL